MPQTYIKIKHESTIKQKTTIITKYLKILQRFTISTKILHEK